MQGKLGVIKMAILVSKIVVMLAVSVCILAVSLDDLYPYGLPQDKQILTNDDGSSLRIDLNPPLRFYNQSYDGCHIHNNGIVSFNEPPEHFLNDPFPIAGHTFVAPFFGDVDTRKAGTVWYTDPVSTDSDILEKARKDISGAFACCNFYPAYLVISTWDHVGYFKEQNDKLNTFQCVIATDGTQSYAIFLYNETEWTTQYDPDDPALKPTPAKVGFNYGKIDSAWDEICTSVHFPSLIIVILCHKSFSLFLAGPLTGQSNISWEIPCSGTSEIMNISMTSNIGQPGVWIFRIDKEEIIPACVNESQETQCCNNDPCFKRHATAQFEFKCMCSNTARTEPDVNENDNGNERAVWFGVGFGTGVGVTVVICSGVLALVIGILVNQILKLKKKNLLTELGEK